MADDLSRPATWAKLWTWSEVLAESGRVTVAADDSELRDIAQELGLEAVSRLEATLNLTPWLDGVELVGRVAATVTQVCGLSLEPFDVQIDEPLHVRIVPVGSPNLPEPESGELVVDLDSEDPPEPAVDGRLDLCGYVVEALALALDPFPRKPGATFSAPEPAGTISPFAILSELPRRPT